MFFFWKIGKVLKGNYLQPKLFSKRKVSAGFTFVEIIVATAVFLIISLSVYQAYSGLLSLVRASRIKITAADLANEQFEIVKNLSYQDVGLVAGAPAGKIPASQNLVRDGISFVVDSFVRNVDDPFDGTIGGIPDDLSPADYKLLEIKISCPTCKDFNTMIFTGRVAPKNLEVASTNGSLFVRAFDKNGQPVPQASVHIVNGTVGPPVDINEETNNQGIFQLIDTVPAVDSYQITVTKSGYSTDKTYAVNGVEVDTPVKPHATVALQQVTQTSFAIDKVSTINLSTLRSNCAAVPNVSFSIDGVKTIGTKAGNSVLKYGSNQITDASGNRTLSNMEWDTYNISLNDPNYDLAGTISPLPVALDPDSTQNVTLVTTNKNPDTLLVTVKDAVTGLPVTDASVELTDGGAYDVTKITHQGFLSQTDWQGGSGQADFSSDATKYFTTDGNIEDNNPTGELGLKQLFSPGPFQTHGELTSSTFDTGSPSNFHQILWNPTNQPVDVGSPSVRLQIATNATNDGTETWNFIGPDGTGGTYYTVGSQDISVDHNGNRYLRYRLILDSAVVTDTPTINDVSFTFTSSCVPPGQVFFDGLGSGSYTYTVTKAGYQTYTGNVNVSSGWQNQDVVFQPS